MDTRGLTHRCRFTITEIFENKIEGRCRWIITLNSDPTVVNMEIKQAEGSKYVLDNMWLRCGLENARGPIKSTKY